MKGSAEKSGKSATVQKRKRSSTRAATEMERRITPAFADQVAAFIKRYRPALEALAKK